MNSLHSLQPNRRRFLATTALVLGAAPFIRAQSKTAPEFHGSIIGHGTHRYRVDK